MAVANPTANTRQSWLPLATAAELLGETADSLRKKLERASRRAADGAVEATLDGVTARKLGRLWKLRLSSAWM